MVALTTELLSLLQTALALSSKKAELDKQYFEQFIEPVWDAFSKVHENYKATFKSYIEAISSSDYDVDQLIEKIRTDSIETDDLRAELAHMVVNLPTAQLKTRGEYLANFAQSVAEYFNLYGSRLEVVKLDSGRVLGYQDLSTNMIRFEVLIHLSRKGHARKESREFLDKTLMRLQKRYSDVASAYQQLRTSLLT